MEMVKRSVIEPTLKGLADSGSSFSGCLYPGLKLLPAGLKCWSFNARFGDPKRKVILRLLETDLVDVIEACLEHRLGEIQLQWKPVFAVCASWLRVVIRVTMKPD